MNLDMLEIGNDVEKDVDFIPGNNFIFDTGIYPCIIDMAFMGESAGGAISLTLHLKEVDGKRTHQETFYVTSGKAKGRLHYYVDRGGNKRNLPGMSAMNQLSIIVTDKKLSKLKPENRTIKLRNFEAQKDLPTEVPALVELCGKQVTVALTKCRENKRVKVGDEYIDTAEERVFNEVTQFLHENGTTVAETHDGSSETAWKDKWLSTCGSEYVRDKYKEIAIGSSVEAASADAAAANEETVKGLFDD